jgi:predicted ATPase/DNA-binding winged helix-turn-helix (wHTH) protein
LSITSLDRVVSFGPFHLHLDRRLLLEGGRSLRVGSRALEVLIALVERASELVSKDELMAQVWPNTTVEESNLKVHIAALRRALADGQGGNRYIQTVPGRGYRFVAAISPAEAAGASSASVPMPRHNLPGMVTRLIGRAGVVSNLVGHVPQQHFVTIVGTGGVGTTSVALATAEALLPDYEDGVWLVELAPLADPGLVPAAVAAALGLEVHAEDPMPELLGAIRERHMLLLLDSCEHVIGSAADLAVTILRDAPRIDILATSREPLRAHGEHVYRLLPLVSPSAKSRPSAAEALAFPAVQLFVNRVAASLGEFELTDADAPVVADICAKLDGVPLAIESAAAQVYAFGLRGVAIYLDDRLRLLRGHRTALPRHQNLKATLDWSYDVLPEIERLVLRCLGIFAGVFSLEAAIAVVAGHNVPESDIANCVANLIAKSLVVANVSGSGVLYQLLETTRLYAREKLVGSGEFERIARRHTEYYRDLFESVEVDWRTKSTAEISHNYPHNIDEDAHGDVHRYVPRQAGTGPGACRTIALTRAGVARGISGVSR